MIKQIMPEEMREQEKKTKKKSLLSFFLKAVLGLVFVCVFSVVALSALVFYALQKNENMEWLSTQLETVLNEKLKNEFELKIGKARFASDSASFASLYLDDIHVQDKKGKVRGKLESLYLVPNWQALLDRRLEVKAIKIQNADFTLVYDEVPSTHKDEIIEKSIRDIHLALETPYLTGTQFPSLTDIAFSERDKNIKEDENALVMPELLALLDKTFSQADLFFDEISKRKLDLIDVSNVKLTLHNASKDTKRLIQIEKAELLSENDDGQAHRLSVSTLQRSEKGVSFSLKHFLREDQKMFEFEASNIIASNFVERLNSPDYPIKIALPFAAKGHVALDNNEKKVEEFDLNLKAGKGSITTGPKSTFDIDHGTLALSLNRRARSILVKPSPFLFTKNHFEVEGEIKLPNRLKDPYFFNLFANDTYLESPDVQSPPLIVDKVTAKGALQPENKLVSVSSFKIQAENIDFQAAASFGFNGKTPSMALAGETSPFNVDQAKQLWPIFIAPSARSWTLKNVKKGRITSLNIQTSVPTNVLGRLRKGAMMADDEMQLDFDLKNATFEAYGDFPLIEQAHVHGKTRGISFSADLKSGKAFSKFEGTVSLEKAHFEIPDFRFPDPKANLSFQVKGLAKDVGEISDRKPVHALELAEMQAEALKGNVSAAVSLSLPLKKQLKAEEIDWQANLLVDDFGSDQKIEKRDIQNANAEIEIVPGFLTIKGKADIDGIKANINLLRPFNKQNKNGSLDVNVVLDDAARKKLGLGLDNYLKGPVAVSIAQNENNNQSEKGDLYKVDLKNAEIRLDFLGWRKAKGAAATLTMELKSSSKGTIIRNFDLKGEGFKAKGELDLTPKGEVLRLKLTDFALKNGDNVQVLADLMPEKTYKVTVSGNAFDARSIIRVLTATPTGEGEEDPYRYIIKMKLNRIVGYLGEAITSFQLDTVLRGATPLRLEVSGLTKGAANPFNLSYGARQGRGDVLFAQGSDGGALARFSNIYYRAFGGGFRLVAERPPGARAMSGNFRMTNFRLVEEPALKGLSNSKDGKGQSSVRFDVLDMNFKEENQRLNLTRGLLTGENIGGTYQGVLNRKTKAINFTGTYVPAYVLNNFITKIPILGLALGNGQREGLIGVTFKVEGTLGKPKVSVNPLSALAPGFLRQLFKFRKSVEKTN